MLSLFSDIQPVKGYLRHLLIDINRAEFYFIPDNLFKIIRKYNKKIELDELKKIYLPKYNDLYEDYYSFLLKNELVFDIDYSKIICFNEIKFDFDYPFIIENIVISITKNNNALIQKNIENNFFTITKNIAFIINQNVSIRSIIEILELLYSKQLPYCEVVLDSSYKRNETVIKLIKEGLIKIKYYDYETESNTNSYYYKTISSLCCNIIMFTESQAHHTYFNRKLYIGAKGEIKNAPECEETFGNINDIKDVEELKQIIATPEFQKYWFVHKELCTVCKDCEFRHMCVDNRLPYKRKDSSWYHKTECNYNPYICKWKDEEGYQTLEEIGVISNENGFSINHKKIASINKILWEEK